MIVGVSCDCWHRLWLLASLVIAGIVCDCWHRLWVLVLCVVAGTARDCWHREWSLASCAVADAVHDCRRRVVIGTVCFAGTACGYWHRVLLVATRVIVGIVCDYCHHVIVGGQYFSYIICNRNNAVMSIVCIISCYILTKISDYPTCWKSRSTFKIGQYRPDRGLLKRTRSRPDHRSELCFWQFHPGRSQ